MKKFLAVALICALAVSYAACETDTPAENIEDEKAEMITEESLGNWMAKSDNYSRDVVEAVETLSSYSAEELSLPADLKEYQLMPDDTYQTLEGKDYVCISVFSDLGDRMYNNGVLYYCPSEKKAYKVDYLTGDLLELASK